MGKAYSSDIRERVLRHIEAGHARRDSAARFGVSPGFAIKLDRRVRETGSSKPSPQGRPPGSGPLAAFRDYLIGLVEARPDITLRELDETLEANHGHRSHQSSISRLLKTAGLSYKKSLMASECGRDDVKRKRREFITPRQARVREEPHRLVFIDETATTTKMTRLHGRSDRGKKLHAAAPLGHGKTQTFIAVLRHDGLTATWVINGPMNREMFELYIETQLAPSLEPGDVVILDNLAAHKNERAKAILRERGAWFLFLPPYSPDHNPTEINRPVSRTQGARGLIFSRLQAHLRRVGARTINALWQVVGEICDLYNSDECWSYFKAAGYGFD